MRYNLSALNNDIKKAYTTLRYEGFPSLTKKVIRRLSSRKILVASPAKLILSPLVQILPRNPALIESVGLTEQSDFSLKLPLTDLKLLDKFTQDFRVAAIVHIFYPDLTEKIFKYLSNIPFHFDVYITTDSENKKEEISSYLVNHKLPFKEVRVLPNRGRDIAPMLLGCKDVIQNYEYILHLHSKKSPHGGQALSSWGEYCYQNLLGSKEIVQSIFYLLHKCNVGIVAPQHFPPLRGCINWGGNYELTKDLLDKLGYKINSDSLLDFPSGSMFWTNAEILRRIVDTKLKLEDFPPENKQIDGTLAHYIERSLFFVSEITGSLVGVS